MLTPHLYSSGITGWAESYNTKAAASARWGLSWGTKAKGRDKLSNGVVGLPRLMREAGLAS
jgi:hypothetical protein